MYSDLEKYIKQYKIIASEYSKKLVQLQEKYSSPLIEINKSKKRDNLSHHFFIIL